MNTCADLPYNNAYFNVNGIYQGGPSWNNSNNVTSSLSWTSYINPKGHTPNCSWFAYGGSSYEYLIWTN